MSANFPGNTDPKRNNLTGGSEGVSKNAAAAAAAVAASAAVSGGATSGGVTSNLNISPPHQPASSASVGPPGAGGPVMNNGGKDTSNSDVQRLQEQLNDIKEQVKSHFTGLSRAAVVWKKVHR